MFFATSFGCYFSATLIVLFLRDVQFYKVQSARYRVNEFIVPFLIMPEAPTGVSGALMDNKQN